MADTKPSPINALSHQKINPLIKVLQRLYGFETAPFTRQMANLRIEMNDRFQPEPIEDVTAKFASKANRFRQVGDEYFCKGEYVDAFMAYTDSLACAPVGSEQVGHAHANRSAALMKLNNPRHSVIELDRALASNYPEDKKQKLRDRRDRILSGLTKSPTRRANADAGRDVGSVEAMTSESENELKTDAEWRKLCGDLNNPLLPNASNKVALHFDETWGRHMIATEDIEAGEILSCQPYFSLRVAFEAKYEHCSHCLAKCYTVLPCPTCNQALYCSTECLSAAYKRYHRVECQILRGLDVYEELNNEDLMAVRMLLIGTGQGVHLKKLMAKLTIWDIFAENVDPTGKPFANDYLSTLRLCRTFDSPLLTHTSKPAAIVKLIVALRNAGFFNDVVAPAESNKAYLETKNTEKNVEHERDDEKNDEDSYKDLDSVDSADEWNDKMEGADANNDEDKMQILEKKEDLSTIVGDEFIKKGVCYYCELCGICWMYNPRVNHPEILRAHCRTPLHLERCSSENLGEQVRSNGKEFIVSSKTFRTDGKPQLNFTSKIGPSSERTNSAPQDVCSVDTQPNPRNVDPLKRSNNEKKFFISRTDEKSQFNFNSQPGPSRRTRTASQKIRLTDKNQNQHHDLLEPFKRLTLEELFVALLLFNNMVATRMNVFVLTQLNNQGGNQTGVGLGICTLHSMVNHSCNPNSCLITRGQKQALVAVRPISKGEQIFIAYSHTFVSYPREYRNQTLSDPFTGFRFTCQCEACINDWPTYNILILGRARFLSSTDVRKAKKVLRRIALPITTNKICELSWEEIRQVICRLCTWIHVNMQKPSIAISDCQDLVGFFMKYYYDSLASKYLTEVKAREKIQRDLTAIVAYIHL